MKIAGPQTNKNKQETYNNRRHFCAFLYIMTTVHSYSDAPPSPPPTQQPPVSQGSPNQTQPLEEVVKRHSQFYLDAVVPTDAVILQV
jgi:hypothetical protein